jgi:hypothetical protein
MKDRSQEYRRLAAEAIKLAATTDDFNSHAQYIALAQMWSDLAQETEERRATFTQAQDAFNNAQIIQQQQQEKPREPDKDKS